MHCSVQPEDRIFVKWYGFLSFSKNMGKNTGKNISKNFSGKYSLRLLDNAKQSVTDVLKTSSKRVIQKTAETTDDLITNKITGVSKNPRQNNSETVIDEHDNEIPKKIPKERYIFPEKRRKNYWWSEINIIVYQKAAETTDDLIGNKIANKFLGVSNNSQQNNSETVTNEYDKEIPKERCISPEERQQIIDNLRLI